MDDLLSGQDLIEAGLADLERGGDSVAALLVSVGAPRPHRLGVRLYRTIPSPKRHLFLIHPRL